MAINEVMVPQLPTTLPETLPGFRKEYATGMSRMTLMESIAKGSSWILRSFSGYIED